jgi:methyl-accepting chemotaxis protein
MNYFANLKVSIKLSILILIALLFMSIIGYTGYYYLLQSNAEMKLIYSDRLIPVKTINSLRTDVAMANAATMELMLTTDNKRNQDLKNMIDDVAKKSNDKFTEFEKFHLDPKGKDLLAKTQTSKQKYRDARQSVIDLAVQNKNAEAYTKYVMDVAPLATEFMKDLSNFSDYYASLSEKTISNTQIEFEKSNQIIIAIIFIFFMILGLSGFYITRIITKPLNKMVVFCKEVAAGDFRDKPRTFLRKDEFGQLADTMIIMRDSMRKLMKNVNESAEQVAASSEELTASAEQSAQAANQVAESITDVARGAEQQLAVANDTSAVMQQMSTSIHQIASNTNAVAEQSALAANKAAEGNKAIDKAVNQMANIKETVNTSSNVVAKLGESSKEIGQIVHTISGIAAQTNLLALNAAIEAARAGEQGRGFAVVAEEVRKLAEQSQEAAKKITTLIGEIQGDTDKAVVAMNNGTQEVQLGTEVVNASGQTFQEITVLVTHVSTQVKEISTTIEQLAIGSQQIVNSVKQIDELSKKTSGEAQTVSAATEEQSASMEEIASASQALARLATNLRESINKFQI